MSNLARSLGKCLLALPALPALAAGCATPAPIIRLHPRGDDVVWSAGRAALMREREGVRVAAAFDRQDERLLALRVEVENRSSEAVEVDPGNMTYTTCTGGTRATCRQGDTVVDPEGMLVRLDERRARERAAASDDRNTMAPLLFLGAVGDIASLGSRRPTNSAGATSADMDRDEARHADAISRAEAEKEMWANFALRRTTLFPGQTMAGIVYLPIDEGAHLVWLQVEIGTRRFPFCFEQKVKRVRLRS